jgi:hypothetical protein
MDHIKIYSVLYTVLIVTLLYFNCNLLNTDFNHVWNSKSYVKTNVAHIIEISLKMDY